MEKTIIVDGKQVHLKSTGATPIRYKAQFTKDFFADILKLNVLNKLEVDENGNVNTDNLDFNQLDFEVFYNIIWTLAKTADSNIPEPLEWLDGFDEFPLMDILPEVQDILSSTLSQSKKK